MTYRTTRLPFAALALLLGAAACKSPAKADDALLRDLNEASTVGIEMAPSAKGTAVVSAIESQKPTVTSPTPRRVAKAPQPRRAPSPQRAPVPEPTVANAPETAPAPAVTEPAPVMKPQSRPATRSRGTWTTSDVIRNAPFPINP